MFSFAVAGKMEIVREHNYFSSLQFLSDSVDLSRMNSLKVGPIILLDTKHSDQQMYSVDSIRIYFRNHPHLLLTLKH